MKLSEKITYCRKKTGMSQVDLADALEVSRQSVSKWETGEANPEINKLARLAKVLNVSADWLLSEEEEDLPVLEESRVQLHGSIKPGRAPSAMGVLMGIVVALFGIFWTIMTLSMGAPVFFSIFGVFFVILALVQTVFHYRNATGKKRYSLYDITDDDDEPDPFL